MPEVRHDVLAIGNAIVDVLTHADDMDVGRLGLSKGTMTLIDAERAHALYESMGPTVESSGGSAANTVAALASFGGQGAFIGMVRDDSMGTIFRHDIRAAGIAFDAGAAKEGPSTGRCLIFITPDAQRTMQTYLGAATTLGPEDVDPAMVAAAQVTYLEGYLWDPPRAKEAFRKAATIAAEAGRDVSLTLSDPFCVDRHRADFLDLVENHVDVLFANEDEIKALYQVDAFDDGLQRVRHHCRVAALTRSEKGSVVVSGDEVHVVDAAPVAEIRDTTGAGDAYAAGFLFGLTQGRDLAICARIGGIAAAEVISHVGARPERSLKDLAAGL